MSHRKIKNPKKKAKPIRSWKALSLSVVLTEKQSRWAAAFAAGRTKAKSAVLAGYKGNPSRAGYQVFKALQKKAPDVIASMGIELENVIEHYVVPKLDATELKQFEVDVEEEGNGKKKDVVRRKFVLHVEAHMVNLAAARMLLELMNAFPPEDPVAAQRIDVDTIVIDMPRPVFPNPHNYDVPPTYGNAPKKELAAEKSDPRPKD